MFPAPQRQINVHRKSKTAHPGITIIMPSLGKEYILRCPNDEMPPSVMKNYLESVFKDTDDMTVDKIINREFGKESMVSPMLVPSLKR